MCKMTLFDILLWLVGCVLGVVLIAPRLPHAIPVWASLPLGVLVGIFAVLGTFTVVSLILRKTIRSKSDEKTD